MNYDPNLTNSGKMAKQTVRLTFACWDYRKTLEVEVGGNCTGLEVISCAVRIALESLPTAGWDTSGEAASLVLERTIDGELQTLDCTDEELAYEDWLGEMLIGAEITAIRPED